MNIEAWRIFCIKAISFLSHIGITYVNNEKTICKWNQRFKKFEKFDFPYGRQLREPKLCNFLPEARNKMIRFCNKEITSEHLSTESFLNEIRIICFLYAILIYLIIMKAI